MKPAQRGRGPVGFSGLKKINKATVKRLLSYVILTQKRVLVHLKKFDYYANNDYLKIDSGSVKSLELIESIRGGKNKNNLFVLLDKCSTSMGSRFLKKNILFPLVSVKEITFTQEINLQGGEYLLSLGVTGYEKEDFQVYHRLYDALDVTVISDKNTVGFYDMESAITVEDVKESDNILQYRKA